jgi:hypothetical protein
VQTAYDPPMKFLWSIIVYLIIGALLSWGILLMMHGKPWLLIGVAVAYILALAKLGCLSH